MVSNAIRFEFSPRTPPNLNSAEFIPMMMIRNPQINGERETILLERMEFDLQSEMSTSSRSTFPITSGIRIDPDVQQDVPLAEGSSPPRTLPEFVWF